MVWFLKNWKLVAGGIAALAIALSVYAGYRFVTNLVHQNELLAGRVGQLETAKAVQDATIATQQDAIEEWQQFRSNLAVQLQELSDVRIDARRERERLLELFASTDLGQELADDPDAALARINSDLARSRCLLEGASGGAQTDCGGGGDREALAPTIAETGTD